MAPLCEWALLVNDHLWVCSLLPYYFPLINFIEADKAECRVAYPTSRYFPCSQQRYSSWKCHMSPMFHLAIDTQSTALLIVQQSDNYGTTPLVVQHRELLGDGTITFKSYRSVLIWCGFPHWTFSIHAMTQLCICCIQKYCHSLRCQIFLSVCQELRKRE